MSDDSKNPKAQDKPLSRAAHIIAQRAETLLHQFEHDYNIRIGRDVSGLRFEVSDRMDMEFRKHNVYPLYGLGAERTLIGIPAVVIHDMPSDTLRLSLSSTCKIP